MSVYFAQVGEYVKVGYSADPIQRAHTLTRNGERPDDIPFGADVDLIGWIPGDRKLERALHHRFGSHWIAGEWFRMDTSAAHEIIKADPQGVDLQRMGGLACIYMWKRPELTRDDLEAAGVIVWADPDTTAAVLRALGRRPEKFGGAA
jgi:hypothetical protein